jgi:hypothetical protein
MPTTALNNNCSAYDTLSKLNKLRVLQDYPTTYLLKINSTACYPFDSTLLVQRMRV